MAPRTPNQNMAPAGRRPYKKTGIRPPRTVRTTAAYKHWIDEAIRALAAGKIDANTAYAIEKLALSGAVTVLSINMQKRTKEGIVILEDSDMEEAGDAAEDYEDPLEIEGKAHEVVDVVPDTPNAGTKKIQRFAGAQIVELIAPPRPANDVKPPDDAEDGGD